MEQVKTRVKKWGNSFGIILPRRLLERENLTEGVEVTISIESNHKTKVKDLFGVLKGKLKRPTIEVMKEIDKDLWPKNE